MRFNSYRVWPVVLGAVLLSLTACKQQTQTATNEAANAAQAAAKDAYRTGIPWC